MTDTTNQKLFNALNALAASEAARQEAEKENARLRRIVAKDPNTVMITCEDGTHQRLVRAVGKLERQNMFLIDSVQYLLDHDPNDDAADGVTVLDVWRKEARALLASREKRHDR